MFQRQIYTFLAIALSVTVGLFHPSAGPAVKASKAINLYRLQPPVYEPPAPDAAPVPIAPAKEEYKIDVVMDYERHFLTVEETIVYPNRANARLDSLTLAVPSNLNTNTFELTRLSVDNIPITDYNLNGQRLDIPLPTPLEPDSATRLTLRFTLSLPYLDRFNSINARVFGYTDAQTNLINWYPFVVPFINGEWVLHDPVEYGDYLVYPVADYEVNLLFVGGGDAPVVAASGRPESIGDFSRYTLHNGRAFAFSISPNFQVSSMQAGDVTVSSYYLPGYRKSAEAAMEAGAQAIEYFSEQFGSYPYPSLSIVEADLSDSREFSGLSFISRNFYQQYDGTAKNYLTYASVHTAAHQWWFDQVGNDQAMEPWLDEALATYSEALYFENYYPDLLEYWQTNRVDFFRPHGRIDISIYDGVNHDIYKQAAYFNGVYFLRDLRKRIGDPAFFEFLQDYYLRGRRHIATTADFFNILDKHTDVNYSDILAEYFAAR